MRLNSGLSPGDITKHLNATEGTGVTRPFAFSWGSFAQLGNQPASVLEQLYDCGCPCRIQYVFVVSATQIFQLVICGSIWMEPRFGESQAPSETKQFAWWMFC